MFGFTKETFIALLNFGGSFAAKCVSLNNQPYISQPTPIDLNPDELCHTFDDLSDTR